jgi:peptide/nickel transport system substrate-binding protein
MENRFGIKDLFLFVLLFAIIGLIALCLVQYDRQWAQITQLKDQTSSLTNDLTSIRRLIADLPRGPVVVQANPSTQQGTGNAGQATAPAAAGDPFAAIKAAEQMPGFARGDWLVENFGTNIGKITPFISTDVYGTIVQCRVTEPLAARDPVTLEYVPMLATNWEKSADGKTIAFNLRPGVTFSDGKPFTAEDVVFTFDLIMNKDIDAPRTRSYLSHLESVKAEGELRVVFKFKEFIFNTFETVSGTGILPKHFYGRFMKETREYNENPGLLMGTGPYRMATPDGWRPGQPIELFRNERYWGTPPAFDKLVYREVKDDVVQETMFRNRETDRFAATPEQFIKLRDDPQITARSTHHEFYSPLGGYTYIGWNQQRKQGDASRPTPFADKRVRQAMTMLIDRERLAREIYYGFAQPATGPFGYGTPQSDPDIKPWPYDVEAAKAKLAEAGYSDKNGDGLIEGPDGKPFGFTLSYPSGNPFTDRIVLFIKDSFAKSGVQVKLDAVDWPIFIKKLENRDFEASTLGWTTSIETDCNQIFHSSQMKDNGDNVISYSSPECDAAIDRARATVDDAERMKRWREVHKIIAEDQPYTFLLNRQSLQFIDSRIQNVGKSKMGLNYVWQEYSPYPWFVPADKQLRRAAN